MFNRRETDRDQAAEIERMISEESDARVRVQLMMMHKLTNAVAEISQNVSYLDKKFSTHANDEAALVNQVKGGWKVAAWVFGIAQVVVAGAYMDMRMDVRTLKDAQVNVAVKVERMSENIKSIEHRMEVK